MQTPLYEWHVANNATIVDFAGWKMPLHYGSQLEEHQWVRNHAGLFDVSHMNVVDVTGKDARNYLKLLLANNVEKLKPGRALYTCMLNESGGILDDLIVYYLAENFFRLILNAGTREKDLNWLNDTSYGFSDLAVQAQPSMAIIALQGSEAIKIARRACEIIPEKLFGVVNDDTKMIARTGYTGEDGVEIILPVAHSLKLWEALIECGAKPIGLGARDSLRLEAGLNLYGSDMDETVTPLESNLTWTVAFEPIDRRFIGRERLEEQREKGVPYKLIGVILESGGILRHGQKIYSHDQEVGVITSGGFSPQLNHSIGMARLQNKPFPAIEVDIRGKRLPVSMTTLPFIKRK